MKKALILILCSMVMLSAFTSCEEEKTKKKSASDDADETIQESETETEEIPAIPEELTGTWYGPANQPELSVMSDCSGTVSFFGAEGAGIYSVSDGEFSIESDNYNLSGDYTLEGDTLTVDNGETQSVFTREEKESSDIFEGEWYGGDEDDIICINYLEDGKGSFINENSVETAFFYVVDEDEEQIVYAFLNGSSFAGRYETGDVPLVPDPRSDGEAIQIWNSDSLVGTWYDEELDGTYEIYDDGTGDVSVMGGLIKGELEYTYEDNEVELDVTVKIFGREQSGSGGGTVYFDGATLCIDRGSDGVMELTRE